MLPADATREQRIAHLVLHGYLPFIDTHGWMTVWNGESGRMCKYFHKGNAGPGWDVRAIISRFAILHHNEVPSWEVVTSEQLAQLTAPTLPPRFKHDFRSMSRDNLL